MYVVFDKDDNPWGPFKSAIEAAEWAAKKWPDQKEATDEERTGWVVAFLRGPDA
jgi:hypothetical protein